MESAMRAPRRPAAVVPLVLAAALTAPPSALAQGDACGGYSGRPRRICDAAVDGTRAFHPVAGLLVSGGNPVLGTASTLGGLGHISVTARVNAMNVVLPALNYSGTSDTVPVGDEIFAPAPVLEAAAGIYQGSAAGLFSVDLLASAQLLPTDEFEDFRVDEDATRLAGVALGLGYGARIGLLREWGPVPGVSLSVMRRDIPELLYGDLAGGDQYDYALDLHATNVRVVASKRLLVFDAAAGLGWDRYSGDATIRFRNPLTGLPEPPLEFELRSSRLMAFLNAGLDLSAVRLVGEVGYQGGRDQELTTTFEDFDTTTGRFFGGLGVRLSL
jgi:hypothetical protein